MTKSKTHMYKIDFQWLNQRSTIESWCSYEASHRDYKLHLHRGLHDEEALNQVDKIVATVERGPPK